MCVCCWTEKIPQPFFARESKKQKSRTWLWITLYARDLGFTCAWLVFRVCAAKRNFSANNRFIDDPLIPASRMTSWSRRSTSPTSSVTSCTTWWPRRDSSARIPPPQGATTRSRSRRRYLLHRRTLYSFAVRDPKDGSDSNVNPGAEAWWPYFESEVEERMSTRRRVNITNEENCFYAAWCGFFCSA